MWGIVHNLIRPTEPAPTIVECSCGWRGQVAEVPEHVAEVAKASRDRIIEFVDFVDEEVGSGNWRDIDMFGSDRAFLTPAGFVTAMNNLRFKKIP